MPKDKGYPKGHPKHKIKALKKTKVVRKKKSGRGK